MLGKVCLSVLGIVVLLDVVSGAWVGGKGIKREEAIDVGEGLIAAFIESWEECQAEGDPESEACQLTDELHAHLGEVGLSEADRLHLDRTTGFVKDTKSTISSKEKENIHGDNGVEYRRGKRIIENKEEVRWDKGIVPYRFTSASSSKEQNDIRRAQLSYERNTCIRFVPYADESTNQIHGIRTGHINFINAGGGCFSKVGKRIDPDGQDVSCCYAWICLHELGHVLGLGHDTKTPVSEDRDAFVRVNYENIRTDKWKNYLPYTEKEDWVSYLEGGYDISSIMHYSIRTNANSERPTFNHMFPETNKITQTSTYYAMKEISMGHKCDELHCSHVTLTCENDGFLTLVDGKCACRCVEGLDPDTGCRTTLSSSTTTQEFPGGSYALPMPKSGCADDVSAQGTRTHYNDGDNSVSARFDVRGDISGKKVEQSFCVTENSDSKDVWPTGNYCILRKGGKCPDGFEEGFVHYDDTLSGGNMNLKTGSLPDGDFGENTKLYYCCQHNGFKWEPLLLPNRKPFVLINYGTENGCQEVRGMHAYEQSMTIAIGDSEGLTALGGQHPGRINSYSKYVQKLCHYEPALIDCGAVVDLTQAASTYSFSSPPGPEKECTWFFKAPTGGKVILSFETFKIAHKEDGECIDKLEIRSFLPGQTGLKYCGHTMDQTIQSLHNTLAVTMSTFGNSNSHFTATVRLQMDEDLCYDVTDRGHSYAGNVNFTRFFEPCLPWAEVTHCRYNPFTEPLSGGANNTLLEGNFCRNPDPSTGIMPWCYTKAEQCERNYCDPCLLGTVYDQDDKCEEDEAAFGICSKEGLGKPAISRCAKTCNFDVQRYGKPQKVSDVSCGIPSEIRDGSMEIGLGKSTFKVGEKVTYRCKTTGVTRDRLCLSSGEWTPMAFVCDVCPPGWHHEISTGHCYDRSDARKTLPDAIKDCRLLGGVVATAKTESENDILRMFPGSDLLLPATDEVKEGTWVWEDGDVVTWTNWQKGQPDNRGSSGQQCVVMRPSSGVWIDRGCSSRFHYVCKTRAYDGVCSDFWNGCQKLILTNANFCKQHGEFALRMCPATCGVCPGGGISQCPVGSTPNGQAKIVESGQIADDGTTVGQGAAVEYICNDGYVAASGNTLRGCLMSGEMGGEPLRCIPGCPVGWAYLPSSRSCASIFTHERLDAETALSRCVELGGLLAMPKTEADNTKLTQLLTERTFIGLDDRLDEGYFAWSDSEPLRLWGWENWNKKDKEPDNSGSEDCVDLRPDGTWHISKCSTQLHYACQVPFHSAEMLVDECAIGNPPTDIVLSVDLKVTPTVALGETVEYSCTGGYSVTSGDTVRRCLPNGQFSGEMITCSKVCPDGWSYLRENSNCYKYIDEAVHWDVARSRCQEFGASLSKPKSASETKWLISLKPRYSIWQWIDLSDRLTESDFIWGDGTSLDKSTWTNWHGSDPNNSGNEDCVFILEEGGWRDGKCHRASRRFTCQTSSQCELGAPPPNIITSVDFMATPSVKLGAAVEYSCADGYSLTSGDEVRQCLANGNLSGKMITCIQNCRVGPVPNGKAINVGSGNTIDVPTMITQGTKVGYSCNEDYIAVSGDSLRECQQDGILSGEPLHCVLGCPHGWTYLPYSGYCVSVFTYEKLDAETAKMRCADLGGSLAMAKNEVGNNELTELANSVGSQTTFIGLNDKDVEGDFIWADGQPLKSSGWSNWSPVQSQPDNLGGEDCVFLRPGGKWFDSKCDSPQHYACQASTESAVMLVDACVIDVPPPNVLVSVDTVTLGDTVQYSCPDGYIPDSGDLVRRCLANGKLSGEMITCRTICPDGWSYRKENGNCYKYIDARAKWAGARARCQELGASLAMPKTASEMEFVIGLKPRYDIWQWIDLSDHVTENEFVWGDSTRLETSGWTLWGRGQPNNSGNEDCVWIKEEGQWMDGKCDKSYRRFTCQMDMKN